MVPAAHWRTLCADQLDTGVGYVRCGPEAASLYEQFKARLASLARGEGMDFSDCLAFGSLIGSRAIAHSFFATTGGRVDLGPLDAKAGDQVCIFRAGSTPFVLRQTDDSSTEGARLENVSLCSLVGDAYVDGIMYGELLEEVEASETLFVLR